jgi:spermidine/putrescine transport system permease protein
MGKLRDAFKQELPFIFICPALVWQVFFLYIPLIILFVYSLVDFMPDGTVRITLEHYNGILQPSALKILKNSFFLAIETVLICILIAFPLTYYISFQLKRFRTFFLMLIILPSWTNFILQVYAWMFLLKRDGFLSHLLYVFGFTATPIHMLNNYPSMVLVMVYCYLPFMVLPIYAVLERVDKQLLEASADLGASRLGTVRRIIFPLSIPGIIAGIFLVFIPAFGEFAIPEFLGGAKNFYWGNIIASKFLDYRDWQSGAATAYTGLLMPIILFGILYVSIRFFRRLLTSGVDREINQKKGGR